MAGLMRTPAETESFVSMSNELHLRVNMTGGDTRMLCSIPDHDAAISAHCRNDVWVLRLITSFVHLPFMVNLLHHVEFDLHIGFSFPSTTSITSDFLTSLVVVGSIRRNRFWKLHVCYLQIVLRFVRSMCANEKSMSRIIFIWSTITVNDLLAHEFASTYDCLSGSHCVVSVGHSNAVLSIKSYKKGAFFFQVLYSSFTIFSSSRASSCSSSSSAATRYHERSSPMRKTTKGDVRPSSWLSIPTNPTRASM